MKNPTKPNKQTIRFLKWINKYSGWWYLICTPREEHMTFSMMKMLVKRLSKERFYEIVFVLLMVHRDADFMDIVFKKMLLEMILASWKGKVKDKDQIIKDIIGLLT